MKKRMVATILYLSILFKDSGNGKMKCGVCQKEYNRLIVHMNGNDYCTAYFSNMEEFEIEYSKFRGKQSRKRPLQREHMKNVIVSKRNK